MLNKRLTINPLARLTRPANGLMGLLTRCVNDIKRAACHISNHNCAVRSLAFHFRRPRIGMAFRPCNAARQKISLHPRHHITILGVNQRQRPKFSAAFE